ncbi:hypothetical protein BvCmsSIP068_04249 [Escherichia coli]|nr:hypothetical protein BvCmsSIP068_04249 [Escherichia coli]
MLPSEIMIWQPEFTDKTLSRKPGAVQSAYEEIMLALRFFFGVEEDENVNEIIGQDHDPIGTIAAALDDYRSVSGEETNV